MQIDFKILFVKISLKSQKTYPKTKEENFIYTFLVIFS